jgi:hypothetical protein
MSNDATGHRRARISHSLFLFSSCAHPRPTILEVAPAKRSRPKQLQKHGSHGAQMVKRCRATALYMSLCVYRVPPPLRLPFRF